MNGGWQRARIRARIVGAAGAALAGGLLHALPEDPTMSTRLFRTCVALAFLGTAPFTLGAKGGCGTFGSTAPAPVVSGTWAIEYDPLMDVEVRIGGAVYHNEISARGGTFSVVHGGTTYPFNVDCARPEVVCPSEVWPQSVAVSQRDATYQHRMWVSIPTQTCIGKLVTPDPKACGTGTLNPDCKPVCDGSIATKVSDAFGLIRDGGTGFDLLLGAGVATNGINCALLAVSAAKADLVNRGQENTASWQSFEMQNGEVKTGYAGGCVWAGAVGPDGRPEAVVLGAAVVITNRFTGDRMN